MMSWRALNLNYVNLHNVENWKWFKNSCLDILLHFLRRVKFLHVVFVAQKSNKWKWKLKIRRSSNWKIKMPKAYKFDEIECGRIEIDWKIENSMSSWKWQWKSKLFHLFMFCVIVAEQKSNRQQIIQVSNEPAFHSHSHRSLAVLCDEINTFFSR